MDSVTKVTPLGDDILSLIGEVLKTHSGTARCLEHLAVDVNGANLRTLWPESFLNEEQDQGPLGTTTPLNSPDLPALPGPQTTGSTKQPASESSPGVWTLTQHSRNHVTLGTRARAMRAGRRPKTVKESHVGSCAEQCPGIHCSQDASVRVA